VLSHVERVAALRRASRRRQIDAGAARVQASMVSQQLEAPPVVAAAYGQVVAAAVAVIANLSQRLAGLEAALTSVFCAHRDAGIVRSQPGLRLVLASRVLAEFGDDPDRYASAKARKAFAGTASITRASGVLQVVVARAVGNRRLSTACHLWAFAALTGSSGARRSYDAHRARGATHHQALRALANRLVDILHGCLRRRCLYDERLAWPAPSRLTRPPARARRVLPCIALLLANGVVPTTSPLSAPLAAGPGQPRRHVAVGGGPGWLDPGPAAGHRVPRPGLPTRLPDA
jgi:hypothetical protein